MSDLRFRRSTRCNNGSCILIATDGERVVIGDSKNPTSHVNVSRDDFAAFLQRVRAGEWLALADSCAEGCRRPRWRRKLCKDHYRQWLANRGDDHPSRARATRVTGTVEERFWAKVDASGDCWEWQAAKTSGYGTFMIEGRCVRAHRWAWEHLVGPIPDGYQLDHLCRNRACVNPDHLEPVTQQENLRRGYGGGWRFTRTHCKHGHELTPENSYWRPDGKGRHCAVCMRGRNQKAAPASQVAS